MLNIKKSFAAIGAAFTIGAMAATPAHATATTGNSFNTIAENIVTGISDLPGLISAISYMMGIIFGVLGILGIKDHVEQPTQKPLKDGAIRLGVAGALFTLPIVYEAAQNLIGTGTAVEAGTLNKIEFDVN